FRVVILLLTCIAMNRSLGDQVQMRNGDQYFGKVLSLNEQTLVIQSDVLGTIRLPRGKVAYVDFGASPPANKVATVASTNEVPHVASESRQSALRLTNTPGDLTAALRQFGGSSNALQQIQKQLLTEGGPE